MGNRVSAAPPRKAWCGKVRQTRAAVVPHHPTPKGVGVGRPYRGTVGWGRKIILEAAQ
jgi:hypothetical protein